jgi:excisionase family DNA binding protein
MKHRSTQSGPRKNPDSPRVHDLRFTTTNSQSFGSVGELVNSQEKRERSRPREIQAFEPAFSDSANEATAGREHGASHLLTVQEVAELLRVPVCWVYNRARQRSLDRLPGLRLGKYWRFHEADIAAWLRRQQP